MKLKRRITLNALAIALSVMSTAAMAKNFAFSVYNASQYPIVSINYTVLFEDTSDYTLLNRIDPKQYYRVLTGFPTYLGPYTPTQSWFNSIKFLDGNGKTHSYEFKGSFGADGSCHSSESDKVQVINIIPETKNPKNDNDFQISCIESN